MNEYIEYNYEETPQSFKTLPKELENCDTVTLTGKAYAVKDVDGDLLDIKDDEALAEKLKAQCDDAYIEDVFFIKCVRQVSEPVPGGLF